MSLLLYIRSYQVDTMLFVGFLFGIGWGLWIGTLVGFNRAEKMAEKLAVRFLEESEDHNVEVIEGGGSQSKTLADMVREKKL